MIDLSTSDHLLDKGYVILERYFDAGVCDRFLRGSRELLTEYQAISSKQGNVFDDGSGNDNSIYGVENTWAEVSLFSESPEILDLANKYMRSVRRILDQRERTREENQLIDHLLRNSDQRGNYEVFNDVGDAYQCWMVKLTGLHHSVGRLNNSGGDWHRDSLFPGIKAMMFLTGVSERNGPLQLYPGSRYYLDNHALCSKESIRVTKRQGTTKYSGRLISENFPDLDPVSLPVGCGSVVLFDTSLVHRGKPIQQGERWALSAYLFKGSPDLRNLHWFHYNGWQGNYIDSPNASC